MEVFKIGSKKKFKCINCGKEYESYKEHSKYCSLDCKKSYLNVDYNCDYCNKQIVVPKSKYIKYKEGIHKNIFCSKECLAKSQTKKVVKICENCGKEYDISNAFKNIQKFCSRDCYYDYIDRNSKKQIKICPICNKDFVTNIESQIYCSTKCRGIHDRVRKKCICNLCGKEFERIASEVDKNTRHYCSFECWMKDLSWNEKDINVLREFYGKIPNIEIQKKLTKVWDINAIKRKAELLGLGIDRTWSNEEEQILIENYSKLSLHELLKLLPNRTTPSIRGKARKYGLYSKFYLDNIYTDEENEYLKNNYLNMTNHELSNRLNRSEGAIAQRLSLLNLYRPKEINKDGYKNLSHFVRSKLYEWKNNVREYYNYTCQVTGRRSNIIVHHIRSFNLLISETIDELNFPIYDIFSDYTDSQLKCFVDKFLEIQEYYGEYTCVTESIHVKFHTLYGYGNNTLEQWNDFLKEYNSNIA